jgi:hypothetical protein
MLTAAPERILRSPSRGDARRPKKMAGGYLSRPPSEISVALASGGHQRDKKNRTTRGGRSAS